MIKADGTKELYEPHKLRNSLIKSGAGSHSADKVLTEIGAYLEETLSALLSVCKNMPAMRLSDIH